MDTRKKVALRDWWRAESAGDAAETDAAASDIGDEGPGDESLARCSCGGEMGVAR